MTSFFPCELWFSALGAKAAENAKGIQSPFSDFRCHRHFAPHEYRTNAVIKLQVGMSPLPRIATSIPSVSCLIKRGQKEKQKEP